MVELVSVRFEGCDEPAELYEVKDGKHFFEYLFRNCSVGDKIHLEMIEMSDEDYKEACRIGDEMA